MMRDFDISDIATHINVAEFDTSKVYIFRVELNADADYHMVHETLGQFAKMLSDKGIKAIFVPHREGFPFEIESIEVKNEQ